MLGHDPQVAVIQLLEIVDWERDPPREHDVEGDSERVNITLGGRLFVADQLRGHVHGGNLFVEGCIEKREEVTVSAKGIVHEFWKASPGEDDV